MVNIFSIFKKRPKILIIVGGNKAKIEPFLDAGQTLSIDVTIASFSELHFSSEGEYKLSINNIDLKDFTHIYIRMVGKRLEDATLVANYAVKHNIKLIDSLYADSLLMPSSLGKSIEMSKIISSNVPMPKTLFGSVSYLEENAIKVLKFPFVLKSTTGKKAREVWSPDTKSDLKKLFKKLSMMEKDGMRFFAQEFVHASERMRVFVIGGEAVAGIVRPTKWRKRTANPEGRKMVLNPIPDEIKRLCIIASKACDLDIAGIDIVRDEKTKELFILEVNAAPVWKALSHDTNINIEQKILEYIVTK